MAGGKNFSILADVELDTKNIQKQLDKIKLKFQVDDKGLKNVTASIKDVGKSTEQASKSVDTLSASTGSATEKVESMILSYQAANAILRKTIDIVTAMTEQVYELDGAVTEFKKVSDLSGEALDKYTNKLAKMGSKVARTSSEMVEAATEFKKSGFSDEDSANLALVATMYQNVADDAISAGEASNFIISQLKAFNLEATESSHIVDALNAVSNNFAVSSTDLSNNLGKASAALATGNNTYEETLGLFTAITEITRNASRAARGLTSIQSRFTQVLDGQSSTGKALLEIYEGLGIEVFDQTGQIRSLYDVMSDLAKVWPELSTNQKDYIALTQSGANQTQNFLALMSNFDTALEATNVAIDSNGSALQENEKYMESLEAKTNNLKATFQDLANNVIENELIKSLLDLANNVLQVLNTKVGQAITQVALITAGLTGLVGVGKYIAGPIIGGITSALTGATAAGAGLMATFAPIAAVIGVVAVAGWNIYKAYREANPTIEEATEKIDGLNSSLQSNEDRIKEIDALPWNEKTDAILREREELERNNQELEEEIKHLKEIRGLKVKQTGGTANVEQFWAEDDQGFRTLIEGAHSYEEAWKQLSETTGKSAGEMQYAGYSVAKTMEEVYLQGDEYNDYLIRSTNDYIDVLKEKGKVDDEDFLNFKKLIDERVEGLSQLDDLSDSDRALIAVQKELNEIYNDSIKYASLLDSGLASNRAEVDALIVKYPELKNGIENCTLATLDLIAKNEIFKNQTINATGKARALLSLAAAAGVASEQLSVLNLIASGDKRAGQAFVARYGASMQSGRYTTSFDAALQNYWSEITSDIEIDEGGVKTSPTYTPPTTTTPSKTSRPTKDPNLTAFESSYKDLKHRYDMGEIAAEEYYNQLEQLIAQYMATEKADAQEMYKYQEEIYEGRKKLQDELTKKTEEEARKRAEKEKEALEKAAREEREALEKRKEAYEAYADFMVDNINERLDEYNKQREDIIKKYDDEIEKLHEVNEETERNVHLGEIQEKLAKAKQTQILVYKNGQYQYIQDIAGISEAQAELDAYNREQKLRQEEERIEQLKNNEVKKIDELIAEWEKYRDEWSGLADDYRKSQDKLLIEQELGINLEKDNWEKRITNARDFVSRYNAIMAQLASPQTSGGPTGTPGGAPGGGMPYEPEGGLEHHFVQQSDGSWVKEDYNGLAHMTFGGDMGITWTPGGTIEEVGIPHGTVVDTPEGEHKSIIGGTGTDDDPYVFGGVNEEYWGKKHARGTLNATGGLSLVGEQGPELRVLGSQDGIIPADVTKNLWSWGMTNPANMMAAIEGSSTTASKSMSVLIENLNLPEVHDGNGFVQYMKNNFWSKTLQFATR